MKIAIPLENGRLADHFGHAPSFAFLTLGTDGAVTDREDLVPPPHSRGVIPRWLTEQGADAVLCGGMGARAVAILEHAGVKVVTGAPAGGPEDLARAFVNGRLVSAGNTCDHDRHGDGHSCRSEDSSE